MFNEDLTSTTFKTIITIIGVETALLMIVGVSPLSFAIKFSFTIISPINVPFLIAEMVFRKNLYKENLQDFNSVFREYSNTIAPTNAEQAALTMTLSDTNNPCVQKFYEEFYDTQTVLSELQQKKDSAQFLWQYRDNKHVKLIKRIKNLNAAWEDVNTEASKQYHNRCKQKKLFWQRNKINRLLSQMRNDNQITNEVSRKSPC